MLCPDKYQNGDKICTIGMQVIYRKNDKKVDYIVYMRSNNVCEYTMDSLWQCNIFTRIINRLISEVDKDISPGYMYWNLYGELGRLEDLPEDMESDITGNVSKLGKGISDSFNPNLSVGNASVSNGNLGGVNQTLIFNFNDPVIDNEERMQKIADYIQKAINWDNTTAGRNV